MKSKLRTYNVLAKFTDTTPKTSECAGYIKFSHDLTQHLYEVFSFISNPPDINQCSFKLHARCYSCGKSSINSFRKCLLTRFPNVDFIEFERER